MCVYIKGFQSRKPSHLYLDGAIFLPHHTYTCSIYYPCCQPWPSLCSFVLRSLYEVLMSCIHVTTTLLHEYANKKWSVYCFSSEITYNNNVIFETT